MAAASPAARRCVRRSRSRGDFAWRRDASVPAKPWLSDDAVWMSPYARAPAAPSAEAVPRGKSGPRELSVLLASHLCESGRVKRLGRCLDSLAALRVRTLVGWHATAEHRPRVLELLARFVRRCSVPPLLLEAAAPRRQFEHYRHLVDQLPTGAVQRRQWVLFSDDDDISSPGRASAYLEALGRAAMPPTACAVHCPEVARRVPSNRSVELASAADVSKAIGKGTVRLERLVEHWGFGVRLDLLRSFFGAHGAGLLAHKLCDLRFREWVRAKAAPMPTFHVEPHEWLYFYDEDKEHAHAHTEIGEADRELAARSGTAPGKVSLMRNVGEMAFVIGFDGPIVGAHLPARQRRARATELVLDALRHPLDAWASMGDAERARYRGVADALADELLELTRSFAAGQCG